MSCEAPLQNPIPEHKSLPNPNPSAITEGSAFPAGTIYKGIDPDYYLRSGEKSLLPSKNNFGNSIGL